jgi:hypothetical protein
LASSVVLTLGVWFISRSSRIKDANPSRRSSPFAILVSLEVQRLQVARDSWSSLRSFAQLVDTRQARLGLGCSFSLPTTTGLLRVAGSLTTNKSRHLFDAVNETTMATASQDIISPVTTEKPELIFSAPSINSEPVELDSTPASPDKVRTRRASRDELLAELDGEEKEVSILAGRVLTATVAKT